MATSDDYRECVAIYPRGATRKAQTKYIKIMTPAQALAALQQDHAAYVAPDQAATVLAQWQQARGRA